jgi:hypothetical protein
MQDLPAQWSFHPAHEEAVSIFVSTYNTSHSTRMVESTVIIGFGKILEIIGVK